MDIRQLEGRSPEQKLLFAARSAESKGLVREARRIRVIARALMKGAAADPDIALESWDEFHNWFDKNRSQGLEFTFEDMYGPESAEAKQVKALLEGYDMLERQLHELYLTLKGETETDGPAPEDTLESDPSEDVTEETIEEVSDEVAEDAAEALGDEAEALTETTEDEAAEEALAPAEDEEASEDEAGEDEDEVNAASFQTPEAKTIHNLMASFKKARVKVEHIGFRGEGCYRVVCASNDQVPGATTFLKRAGMPYRSVEHPSGRLYLDVQMLPLG